MIEEMTAEGSESNARTLATYEDSLHRYIAGSPEGLSGGLKGFLEGVLGRLQPGATILEIGAGFGRDALYFESQGFRVIPTDAAESFIGELQRRGFQPQRLNALTDPIPSADLIYANAVFLHFSREELESVLAKIRAALPAGGILAFTLKEGSGEEWSDAKLDGPRFFRYWQIPELFEVLVRAGFTDIHLDTDQEGPVGWLQVSAS